MRSRTTPINPAPDRARPADRGPETGSASDRLASGTLGTDLVRLARLAAAEHAVRSVLRNPGPAAQEVRP